MSNLNEDFDSDLLRDLHRIVQHQDSAYLSDSHFQKSLSELQNSFIQGKKSFQTENQNIKFSDHTHLREQKNSHFQHLQRQTGTDGLFNYEIQSPGQNQPQKMQIQQSKKSSKLQNQESSDKSYNPVQQISQAFQDNTSSIYDQDSKPYSSRGGFRHKILPEGINMTHKDEMLLGGKVISGLQKNIVSLPFRQPVDIQRWNIPDYLEIVKQPMDLKTIKRKIFNQEYLSLDEIYNDIELIVSNSMKYNELNPDFIRLTRNFEKSYYKIRRDCERNMRKLKTHEEKKNESYAAGKLIKKPPIKHVEQTFPSNQVEIMSSFQFKQLTKLAKKIRLLQPEQQIDLFKKIGIVDTMIIDIKGLNTKQVRSLIKEVQRIQRSKQQMIRNEEKKENSHMTTCDNEFRPRI